MAEHAPRVLIAGKYLRKAGHVCRSILNSVQRLSPAVLRILVYVSIMPRLSTMPILRYLSTMFGAIFLGFGLTYMLYPHVGYSLFGFSSEPTSSTDWEVMKRVMVLFGAKDLFLGAAIVASTWFGTRRSTGLILLAASACAGVDGYVVGKESGTNHWNHWGYGSVMGMIGMVMAGLFG